jgi:hypothetical protein
MDESGIDIAGALGNSHLKWEALYLPVVKRDGVLLKITKAGGLWLPDRTLVEGTPNDVRRLISAKAGSAEFADNYNPPVTEKSRHRNFADRD